MSNCLIVFYPRFGLGSAIKNMSFEPLSCQQEAVLSKGSKFGFLTLIFLSKIISKVEPGIVASIDNVEAPQELRAEIVVKLNTFKLSKIEKISRNDIKYSPI